ncbi:MAG: hypothetical protein HY273_00905 [Gammaproteobacteria bacterium]|nr:hypothetical protein [Gammaproteobacteria bacterium]
MILNIVVEDRQIAINVSDAMLRDAQDFYAKMDRDMDQGWQMSREWIERPSQLERCQIAADKLHTALNTQNETLVLLMAGYILSRVPNVRSVAINTDGEMQETLIEA